MHISRAGEYGVLGLLHLVRQPGGQPVMIDAVSRDESIPKSFLAKIFQDLAKAGLLRSQRGAGGGFTLARPADQITVLEVIEAIDGRIALQRCLTEEPECQRMDECALCTLFAQAQDRLKEVFAQTSLADLSRQQASLGPLRPPVGARPNGVRKPNANGASESKAPGALGVNLRSHGASHDERVDGATAADDAISRPMERPQASPVRDVGRDGAGAWPQAA